MGGYDTSKIKVTSFLFSVVSNSIEQVRRVKSNKKGLAKRLDPIFTCGERGTVVELFTGGIEEIKWAGSSDESPQLNFCLIKLESCRGHSSGELIKIDWFSAFYFV